MSERLSDVDAPESTIGIEVGRLIERIQAGDVPSNPIQLDDDNVDDQWADDEAAYEAEIRSIERGDLARAEDEEDTQPQWRSGGKGSLYCSHSKKGTRNPCMCGSHDEVNEYRGQDGVHLEVGHVVGLTKEVRVGRYVIDFVEVSRLLVPRGSGLFLLRGVPYSRTRNMGGRLASYKNEVCQVLEVDSDDPRSPVEQATVELTINDVKPEPRVLHRTNKPFPECRFDPASYISSQDREDRAPLTCRWVHTSYYPDKRFRRARRPVDGEVLAHFKEGDVEKNRHRTSDTERTRDWRRGSYTKGGSLVPQGKEEVADAKPGGDGRLPRLAGQKYTVADMFSGAGGYTCGAKMAGFRVVCAVDHWPRCNATYRANHPEVELHEADIMAYCNDLTVDHEPVDLVHLSPPCQTWSPAHTCAGKHDEANIAALYACQYIVEMLRPRFLTLEQTFGIVQDRYLPFFNALVQSLTRYGYSLMWRVLPLVAFGLPQTRKRLVMIGAAPGQPLPDWPKPTHSDSPGAGQRQLVSAIRACRRLVDGEDLHDASGARILDRPPWNGSLPMNRTITTSGGQAYHWSGQRELTLAEFARLQGFPDGYKLVGPCVKKQIGNAFPPVVVHQLLKHMRRWLEEIDCIRNRPDTSDVISISSNDDEKDVGSGGGSSDSNHNDWGGRSVFPSSDHGGGMARIDIVTISSDDDADHINIVGNADSALKSVPAYAKVCEDAAAATLFPPSAENRSEEENDRAVWRTKVRTYSISDGSEDAQRRGSTSSSCTSVVFVSSRWLPTIVEGENLSCSTVEEEDRSCGYSPGVHRHQQQLFIRGNVDEILPQKNRPTAASLSTPAHASAGGRHMSVHGVHGEPLSDVNKDPLKPSSVEATANGRDQRVVTSPWLHGYFKVSFFQSETDDNQEGTTPTRTANIQKPAKEVKATYTGIDTIQPTCSRDVDSCAANTTCDGDKSIYRMCGNGVNSDEKDGEDKQKDEKGSPQGWSDEELGYRSKGMAEVGSEESERPGGVLRYKHSEQIAGSTDSVLYLSSQGTFDDISGSALDQDRKRKEEEGKAYQAKRQERIIVKRLFLDDANDDVKISLSKRHCRGEENL